MFDVLEPKKSLSGLPGFQSETLVVTNLTASPAGEVEVVFDVLEPKKSLSGLPGFQSETPTVSVAAYESTSAAQCVPCAAGTYQTKHGAASSCVSCSPGTFSTAVSSGTRSCRSCGRGKYSVSTTLCAGCPRNNTSPGGARSIRECVAEAGFYSWPGETGVLCPKGYYCPGGTNKPIRCPRWSSSPAGATACSRSAARGVVPWLWSLTLSAAWVVVVGAGLFALWRRRFQLRLALQDLALGRPRR